MSLYVLSFVWKKLGKIFVKIPYLFPRKITLYQLNYIPWIWRIFNGFLTIFSPSPQIRRNYLATSSAIWCSWCRNTNRLLCLALSAIHNIIITYIVPLKTLTKQHISFDHIIYYILILIFFSSYLLFNYRNNSKKELYKHNLSIIYVYVPKQSANAYMIIENV